MLIYEPKLILLIISGEIQGTVHSNSAFRTRGQFMPFQPYAGMA
jgi:hypothetical protein